MNSSPYYFGQKAPELISRAARKKIFKTVALCHILLVIVPLGIYTIYSWFKPEPLKTIQVTLYTPAPPQTTTSLPEQPPTPPIPQKPAPPTPAPQPRLKPKPKPAPKPTPKAPAKPKYLSPKDIKFSKTVVKSQTTAPKQQPSFTPLTRKQLAAELSKSVIRIGETSKSSAAQQSYAESVGGFLHARWITPDKNLLGNRLPETTIELVINGNGNVSSARIIQNSGVPAMDTSVSKLLAALERVPSPPNRQPTKITLIMAIDAS